MKVKNNLRTDFLRVGMIADSGVRFQEHVVEVVGEMRRIQFKTEIPHAQLGARNQLAGARRADPGSRIHHLPSHRSPSKRGMRNAPPRPPFATRLSGPRTDIAGWGEGGIAGIWFSLIESSLLSPAHGRDECLALRGLFAGAPLRPRAN